jgi:hypothetical protein
LGKKEEKKNLCADSPPHDCTLADYPSSERVGARPAWLVLFLTSSTVNSLCCMLTLEVLFVHAEKLFIRGE